ncbi:hypothetical protein BGX38DRAFT_1277994 [Terfezia claveryi]|nr:hypothetical protein BGX38DRAFT_1277994 [Terfezia claveryi]
MSLLGPNRRTAGTKKNPLWRPEGFGTEGLKPKFLGTPFKKQDGTLHPRIFRGYLYSPSEMTMPAPLSPMFTIVQSSKNTFLDTHVMAVVAVRKEIEDCPGTHVSAMGAVFAAQSPYNLARTSYEKESLSSFQIKAMREAISAAYGAQAHLKAAGCQRLVITTAQDMEWILRVLVRYSDFVERAEDDEARLHQFIRYAGEMAQLVEFIDTFEAITNIKLQFWPTEKQDLSAAYLWANTAIDTVMSNYERDYYGVFEDSDYDEYDEDDVEDDDDLTVSDEDELEDREESLEVAIQEIDVTPEIATEALAEMLASMDPNIEEEIINIPVPTEETTNAKIPVVTLSDITPRVVLPFDKMVDISGIDCSSFPGQDGKFAYVLAQVAFGTTKLEEILKAQPFLDAAAAVASDPNADEASRFVTSLMRK